MVKKIQEILRDKEKISSLIFGIFILLMFSFIFAPSILAQFIRSTGSTGWGYGYGYGYGIGYGTSDGSYRTTGGSLDQYLYGYGYGYLADEDGGSCEVSAGCSAVCGGSGYTNDGGETCYVGGACSAICGVGSNTLTGIITNNSSQIVSGASVSLSGYNYNNTATSDGLYGQYTFNGVPNGTYTVTVNYTGYNASSTSVLISTYTTRSIVLTPSNVSAPITPTGLTATPASINRISLSWDSVAEADSYSLYRSLTDSSYSSVASGITSTSYSDTGLSISTTYYYKISAVNDAGESDLSAAVSTSTLDFSGDGTVCINGDCSYYTLASALVDADSGKTVYVRGGYTSSSESYPIVVPPMSVTVDCQNSGAVIGTSTTSTITVGAGNLKIQNCTLENVGVNVSAGAHLTLVNNIVNLYDAPYRNTFVWIDSGSSDLSVTSNTINIYFTTSQGSVFILPKTRTTLIDGNSFNYLSTATSTVGSTINANYSNSFTLRNNYFYFPDNLGMTMIGALESTVDSIGTSNFTVNNNTLYYRSCASQCNGIKFTAMNYDLNATVTNNIIYSTESNSNVTGLKFITTGASIIASEDYNGFYNLATSVTTTGSNITLTQGGHDLTLDPLFIPNTFNLVPYSSYLDVSGSSDIGAYSGVRTTTINIDDNGSIDYVSVHATSTSIIGNLKNGDTVNLSAGTYNGFTISSSTVLTDNLIISGAGAETIINAGVDENGISLVGINTSTIQNLVVQNASTTNQTFNITRHPFDYNGHAYNSLVEDSGDGMVMWYGAGMTLVNVSSNDQDIASYVGDTPQNWHLSLLTADDDVYISIYFRDDLVTDCAAIKSFYEGFFGNPSADDDFCQEDVFSWNAVSSTYDYTAPTGPTVTTTYQSGTPDIAVSDNYYAGIKFDSANNNTVSNVTSTDNSYGVWFSGTSADNEVYDSALSGSLSYDLYSDATGSGSSLINVNYNITSSSVGEAPIMNGLLARVFVTSSNGAVVGVPVSVEDNQNLHTENLTTNGDGYTDYSGFPYFEITSSTDGLDATTTNNYSPYLISANDFGDYLATSTTEYLTENQQTFTLTMEYSPYPGNLPTVPSDAIIKLIRANDIYYLFYTNTTSEGIYEVYLTTSTSGADGIWSEPGDSIFSDLAPLSEGRPVDIQYNTSGNYFGIFAFTSSTHNIVFTTSSNAVSWSSSVQVPSNQPGGIWGPTVSLKFLPGTNYVIGSWLSSGGHVYLSSNGGSSWSTTDFCTGNYCYGDSLLPESYYLSYLDVGISGTADNHVLHAGLYYSTSTDRVDTDAGILYASSTDNGTTWTTSTVVGDLANDFGTISRLTQMTLDGNGNPGFVYGRLLGFVEDGPNVYVTTSMHYSHKTDNGEWVTSVLGSDNYLDVSGDGDIYIRDLNYIATDKPVVIYAETGSILKMAVNTSTEFSYETVTSTAVSLFYKPSFAYDTGSETAAISYVIGNQLHFSTSSLPMPAESFDGNLSSIDYAGSNSFTRLIYANSQYNYYYSGLESGNYNIYLTTSTNGANGNWSEPTTALSTIRPSIDGSLSFPIFDVRYNSSTNYFGLTAYVSSTDIMIFTTSSDGVTWGSQVEVYTAVDGDFSEWIVGMDFLEGTDLISIGYEFDKIAFSTDAGVTWSTTTMSAMDSNNDDLIGVGITAGPILHAMYRLNTTTYDEFIYTSSTDSGATWTTSSIHFPHSTSASNNRFVLDENNRPSALLYDEIISDGNFNATGTMLFASLEDGIWSTSTIGQISYLAEDPAEPDLGFYGSKPYVVYYGNGNYAEFVYSSSTASPFIFVTSTIDGANTVGEVGRMSTTYDSANTTAAVAYVTASGELRFATSSLVLPEGGEPPIWDGNLSSINDAVDSHTKLIYVDGVYNLFYSRLKNGSYDIQLTTSTSGAPGTWSDNHVDVFENAGIINMGSPYASFDVEYNYERDYFALAVIASSTSEIIISTSSDGGVWNEKLTNIPANLIMGGISFATGTDLMMLGYGLTSTTFLMSNDNLNTFTTGTVDLAGGAIAGLTARYENGTTTVQGTYFKNLDSGNYNIIYFTTHDVNVFETQTVVADLDGYTFTGGFAVDVDGNAGLTYADYSDSNYKFLYYNNGTWVTSTLTKSNNKFSELAFYNNQPYFAYGADDTSSGLINFAYSTSTNTPYDFIVSTNIDNGNIISDGRVSSAYNNASNIVAVAYVDGNGEPRFVTSSLDLSVSESYVSSSPVLSNLIVTSTVDGTGEVTVNFTLNDANQDNVTVSIWYEECSSGCTFNDDGGVTEFGAMINTTTVESLYGVISPDYDPLNTPDKAEQLPLITTASGANVVTSTWLSLLDLPTGNGTYRIYLSAYDHNGDFSTEIAEVVSTTVLIDNVEPTAPGDLSVNITNSSTVILNLPSTTSTDDNFFDYTIRYATSSPLNGGSPEWRSADDPNLADSNFNGATTTVITGLSVSTTYYFQLFAWDSYGNSTSSVEISTTTLAEEPVYTAPVFEGTDYSFATDGTGLVTLIGTVTDADDDSVTLFVDYSLDDGSTWASSTISTTTVGTISTTGTISGITNTSARRSMTIKWNTQADGVITTTIAQLRLTPFDGTGYGSSDTTPEFEVDNVAPDASSLFFVSTDSTSITLGWEAAAGATTYTVSTTADTATTTSNTSTPYIGLTPNTQYYFQVKAIDVYGNVGSYTTVSSTYTNSNIPATVVGTANGQTSMIVSWNNNENPTGTVYKLAYDDDIVIATTTAVTYTVIGLTADTGYSFKVSALNNDSTYTDYSAVSDEVNTDPVGSPVEMTLNTNTSSTFKLSVSGDNHTVTLNSVVEGVSANLTIASDPVTQSYNLNQATNVASIGMTVTVTAVGSNYASFSLATYTPTTNNSSGGGGGDTTPPTNGSMMVNNNATSTTNVNVVLNLGASGATLVTLSNSTDFSNSIWETYNTKKNWTLTSGAGTKTVYVKFRDNEGNTTKVFSDSIELLSNYIDTIITPTETDDDITEIKNTQCPLTPEQAYKSTQSPSIYYITTDCTKRAFTKSNVFFTYFTSWNEVKITDKLSSIPNDNLGFMPFGPLYNPKYGALVKTVTDPKVYLLLGTEKYWITSESVFNTLNYKWNWIEDIDQRLLNKYTIGSEITYTDHHPNYTIVKYSNDSKVYRLEPNQEGKQVKRWITDEIIFNSLNFRWDRIVTIPGTEVYENGNDLTTNKFIFYSRLEEGMEGLEIRYLQTRLQELGYLDKAIKINGLFGPATKQAVIKLQQEHHLTPAEGFTGPGTRSVLNNY
ncbi:MAG: peptidoglycan-binding protein [Candidatus Magasanikiibacteriota bacterium]